MHAWGLVKDAYKAAHDLMISLWAWFILGLYFAVIVIFSFAYWSLPSNSFYAPYTKYEFGGQVDRHSVESAIINQMRSNAAQSSPPKSLHMTWPPEIYIDGIRFDDDDMIILDVSVDVVDKISGALNHYKLQYRLEMFGSYDTGDETCRFVRLDDEMPDSAAITRSLFKPTGACSTGPSLKLDGEAEKALRRFYAGVDGDPSAVSGWLGRCFYLSATSITTTGFGDIVPLTGIARLMTGLEAILGWIVAGVYITVLSITSPWKRKEEPEAEAAAVAVD